MGACTDSAYAEQFCLAGSYAPIADYSLLETAVSVCREKQAPYHVGNLISTDAFYHDDPEVNEKWRKMGVLAVEMEAAALYMNAARAGKRALAICTVSDHLFRHEKLTVMERQEGFGEMMEIALETSVRFVKSLEGADAQ